MMKIALAVAAAAAVLTTAPLVTPVKAVEMAQGVDVQIGRDRDDRYDRDRYDRDRRQRFDSDTTVGIGPGGVTVGPRQRCRIETTTIERDGRWITREERRCDETGLTDGDDVFGPPHQSFDQRGIGARLGLTRQRRDR
jgi:hypothetical protein